MHSMTTVGVSIARDYDFVYDFLATPKNLFTWADELGTAFHPEGPLDWVAEAPVAIDGPVTIRFSPRNIHGVLDVMALKAGIVVFQAPVRLMRNGAGCELTIGVWHRVEDGEAKRLSDVEWARSDLLTLKTVLEQSGH